MQKQGGRRPGPFYHMDDVKGEGPLIGDYDYNLIYTGSTVHMYVIHTNFVLGTELLICNYST